MGYYPELRTPNSELRTSFVKEALMICLATDFPDLKLFRRGKVRDVYHVDDDTLLVVATDRISAFDYILPNGIPDKGAVLNQLSYFWFNRLRGVVDHHVISIDVADYPAPLRKYADVLAGRSMWVHRSEPFPVECV